MRLERPSAESPAQLWFRDCLIRRNGLFFTRLFLKYPCSALRVFTRSTTARQQFYPRRSGHLQPVSVISVVMGWRLETPHWHDQSVQGLCVPGVCSFAARAAGSARPRRAWHSTNTWAKPKMIAQATRSARRQTISE